MSKLIYLTENDPKSESVHLVTTHDLEQFRMKLLMDIKMILKGHLNKASKRWIKSNEVKKMLGISAGTLQTLRNNGEIPFTRMGGLTYYDAAEIDRILTASKKHL